MATTPLVLTGSRQLAYASLAANVTAVPLDAVIVERFSLPAGVGDLYITRLFANVDTLSGAYVALVPPFDGFELDIIDPNNGSTVDTFGCVRFVNMYTQSARPSLAVSMEFHHPVLMRQSENIEVIGPILAGAGVTGRVICRVTGLRSRIS